MIDKWQETRNAAEKAQAEGKYGFAESLWYTALEETMDFEPTDRRRALSLERLCECLWYQEKFTDAVPLAQELVGIYSKVFGNEHIDTACMQANLGLLYVVQNDQVAAEPILRQALELKRRFLGAAHPDVVRLDGTYKDVIAKLKSQGMSPSSVVTARQWGKTGRFEALNPNAMPVAATAPEVAPAPLAVASAAVPVSSAAAAAAPPAATAPALQHISSEEALRQWQPLFEAA